MKFNIVLSIRIILDFLLGLLLLLFCGLFQFRTVGWFLLKAGDDQIIDENLAGLADSIFTFLLDQ